MLDSSKILFLFSALSVISLSASRIVKRKAPDGQLYVFSSRVGCESVQSEAPCTFMWLLNPYDAKFYNRYNEIMNSTIQPFRSKPDLYSNDCVQSLENAVCLQFAPKCSVADGSRDYGNASKLCQDIYNSCSQSFVNRLKQNNFCRTLETGKHPIRQCVEFFLPSTGACPQPKYKMPPEFLHHYLMISKDLVKDYNNLRRLKYNNSERVFSRECISLLEEISCSPLYCSANETELLIKHNQDDCNKIIKECYDKVVSRLVITSSFSNYLKAVRRNLQKQCDTYPRAATAQLMAQPPILKSFRTAPKSFSVIPKSFRITPKSLRTTPKRTSAEKRTTASPNSAATCHFGHPIAFVAITASFIVKLYV